MATKPKKDGEGGEGRVPPVRQLEFGVVAPPVTPPVLVPTNREAIRQMASDVVGSLSTLPGQPILRDRADALAASKPTAPSPSSPPTNALQIFGVAQLVRAARTTLERNFSEVRVEGEISGLKRSGPGHLYFTLKDDQACLDCVMYAREATRLRFAVEEGHAVRVKGRLTIYEGRGRFQMTVVDIEPTGAGALAIAFEQLKQKLEAEGMFAASRKRARPFLPRCIGVVTSPQGAVIRDIIRVAHRRFPISILLAPTPVQGPAAASGIVLALARLALVPRVDLIIVARGGGSIEDLWCFNDESVARAIAACPVPVISAVGHETDFTIADFVADLRAPTPSAAAELAVPVLTELQTDLAQLRLRAARGTTARLRQSRLWLERARARIGDPRRLIGERRQRLDEWFHRNHRNTLRRVAQRRADLSAVNLAITRAHPHRRIAGQRAQLMALSQTLGAVMKQMMGRRRTRFDAFEDKLGALSPRRVLDRGYSLAFTADGAVLTDAGQVTPGQNVTVALRRGQIAAVVKDVQVPSAPAVDDASGGNIS